MKLLWISVIASSLLWSSATGEHAPDFNLPTLDGKKTHTLSAYQGNVILLNIWASWCKGCKKEMPAFNGLEAKVGKGFKLITVNVDDKKEKAQAFLESVKTKTKSPLHFLALFNPDKSIAKSYGCQAMPSSYLIDKQGIIQDVIVGSLNEDEIAQLVQKIKALK